MIGWNIGQEELEARTDGVDDVWAVMGQTLSEEKQLRVQRSWLLGRSTGHWALVVQFAAGSQPFAESLLVGTEQGGTMIYYPGASQQRAKWIRKDAVISQVSGRLPGAGQIDQFLSQVSNQLAAQPWLRSSCGLFHDVTLAPGESDWLLRDQEGHGLPLSGKQHWKLLSLTGGHPFDLAAEWDGRRLSPVGAMIAGRYRAL